ncbi:hypothetical protein HMPREF9544_00774, partial [Escherichia coli MS 153-1]
VFQLAVQPEGQVAQGFADSGFRIGCHCLTSRTVPGDGDIHAVRMAVTSPVTDFSLKLPEVTFLHRLQGIRDTMKLTVLRGIFPDFPGCRWLPVPAPFKTGSVPLAAESAEPDARLFHKPAIAEPENALAEVNPENATDLPEVFIHVFIPVAVSMMLTVPVAGFSPCRAGKFIQRIHCDGDNAAHLNARPDSVQGD